MSITSFLHTQHDAVQPVDDTVFDTAALVFTIERAFDAPRDAVWTALDDDHAWTWLPFPLLGVRYPSPARGVGVIREMGSVFDPLRFLWVERERFWRYEPGRRITFGVVSGTLVQYLAVRQYAEDMKFSDLGPDRSKLVWTVAVTPRLPLRFSTWFPPAWKLAYRVGGMGPLLTRRVNQIARTTAPAPLATVTAEPARRNAAVRDGAR
ncbi:SRPBCC family protein [Nocardia yamanashiensis]|uniref:SRPBCC family protein n=1 Tax=Nocardia yamanashiensis TaxID=209247 RepID=UPI001E5D5B4B|nr:SRPBCC family protein [Nocardia yamanashiensis]UGT44588.1 SRPBCC family protein [Nocardia yamanashiensis]